MAAPQASAISETPTDHFTVVANNSNNTKMYQCNYCPSRITGTATRCYVHLTGDGKGVARCPSCPAAVRKALQDASEGGTSAHTCMLGQWGARAAPQRRFLGSVLGSALYQRSAPLTAFCVLQRSAFCVLLSAFW